MNDLKEKTEIQQAPHKIRKVNNNKKWNINNDVLREKSKKKMLLQLKFLEVSFESISKIIVI